MRHFTRRGVLYYFTLRIYLVHRDTERISLFSQLGFDSHMRISASNGLSNIAGGKPYVI